ncbi:MAG: cytochrome c [Mariprofundales bacterium]
MQKLTKLFERIGLCTVLLLSFTAFADDAVAPSAVTPSAEIGKQIFGTVCVHCHHINHDTSSVGAPGLQDVIDRHSESWLNKWIKSPSTFAKEDEAAKDLIDSNPYKLVMPTLPEMADDTNRAHIIEYLKTLK